MDEQIRDYIRANRDRYTREAIRGQLLAAGHDPARVDAIWDEAPGMPAGRVQYVSVMLILGGIITVLVAIGLLTSLSYAANPAQAGLILAGALIPPALYFLVGRRVAQRINRSEALRQGNWFFIGCAIPAIFLGLTFGSCLASSLASSLQWGLR